VLEYKKIYTLPFKFEIPNYSSEFLEKRSIIKSWFKYFKRYLYILFKAQSSLEIFHISDEDVNILWINFSAPSLGDSLMDLSSRVLLTDKNVDLLTHEKNAHLYENDLTFSSVFTNKNEVVNKFYDLVIVDSYSTNSIKIKTDVAFFTPFVGLYGYYNGPEVNRVLFSFHQVNNLLGCLYTESEVNESAKCSISISTHDVKIIESINLPKNFIAIVIGGEWEYRTYNNWFKVIEKLLSIDDNLMLVLLGSENAKETEEEILKNISTSNLLSFVSKFTFNQTAQIISKADYLFCCDGGLMHAANAVDTKIIPLFARLQAELQLTIPCKAFPLFDLFDVNNILAEDVILKYIEATNFDHNHLQS
jgi:ADP-heptose:LPS heptosyltransferase